MGGKRKISAAQKEIEMRKIQAGFSQILKVIPYGKGFNWNCLVRRKIILFIIIERKKS